MDQRNRIDEFESMFKRAEREDFAFANVPINSITLVIDRGEQHAMALREALTRFLPRLGDVARWRSVTADHYANVAELVETVGQEPTDLIVTYRLLREAPPVPPYSLGVHLDVLTQATPTPVLVLPGTAAEPKPLGDHLVDHVMVVANKISGDSRLVNYGVRMCADDGTVWLCHVEDQAVFARYSRAIERIPEIETGQAHESLERQLLKEARDFIDTAIERLKTEVPQLTFQSVVAFGHRLQHYRSLIDQHAIDLLVLNTKDEDQLAMHGMAYSLSVEFTDVAMLHL